MLPKEFTSKFPLADGVQESVKIIIGERPYKQKIGDLELAVKASQSKVTLYREVEHIGFLVSKWVKVQDSLEMIFNVLFGHERSLEALALLRASQVKPVCFADYLWFNAKVIMVNASRHDSQHTRKHRNKICTFILEQSDKHVHVLLIGAEAQNAFANVTQELAVVKAIHPSGANLNTMPKAYAREWIECTDKQAFRVFSSN